MNRSQTMLFLLLVVVLAGWVVSTFLYNMERLPETVPLNPLADDPYTLYGPKGFLFFFPAFVTALAAPIAALYLVRGRLPFPGGARLDKLADEARAVVVERVYQVYVITAVFLAVFLNFVEISLAMYAMEHAETYYAHYAGKLWPFLATIGVMIAYLLYNTFIINRWIKKRESGFE